MKFRVLITSGGEVVFAERSRASRPVYYGAPPETGLWRISTPKFEELLAGELEPLTFGSSVEEFDFGFEIAELEEWGRWFKSNRDYVSYRPKSRTLIAVGQLEWKRVKDLKVDEQFTLLSEALLSAVERVASARRKPKDFDSAAFANVIRRALSLSSGSAVSAEPEN